MTPLRVLAGLLFLALALYLFAALLEPERFE
jgi:K+-transporting ATPase KdpF subunit